jgi:Vacuolar protein sorting-associated protein 26
MKERDLWVHSFRMPPDINNSIKMEVGIEDCLHIEFEYNKSKCVFYPALYFPSVFRSKFIISFLVLIMSRLMTTYDLTGTI